MSDDAALWVVEVRDQRNAALVGSEVGEPGRYSSPPQSLESALALIGVLVGHQVTEPGGGRWQVALAGGRRQITLRRPHDDGPTAPA